MFILDVTYTAPLDRVEALLPAHIAWLDAQYAAGVFLASGRKEPREGGVIVAVGGDRAALETLVTTNPFTVEGVATYTITEFIATKTAPALEPYRQQPAP
ncbi:YciI family protein [Streptomyces sp. NPDC048636]|uniref:YciI family protein n=1 Tax=Streptomyces sp. NPDC048636 TaxID=3155762 RepID=UPI003444C062